MTGVQAKQDLSDPELEQIKELEEACCKHESLCMKLNWEMLQKRSPEEINDFLYYEKSKLIGFIGLYGFGSKPAEIEITGMVHPDHRRKGIFRALFLMARQECMERGVKRILLITERNSTAGKSFVLSTGSHYAFSEYKMKFAQSVVPDYPKTGVRIRKAGQLDFSKLKGIDAICFGSPAGELGEDSGQDIYDSAYLAEFGDKTIGKIGALKEGQNGYIFGFGIHPEYRGRGFGREILSLTLSMLKAEKIETVMLEVATQNEKALALYKSCGFKEVTVYDYYEKQATGNRQ